MRAWTADNGAIELNVAEHYASVTRNFSTVIKEYYSLLKDLENTVEEIPDNYYIQSEDYEFLVKELKTVYNKLLDDNEAQYDKESKVLNDEITAILQGCETASDMTEVQLRKRNLLFTWDNPSVDERLQ